MSKLQTRNSAYRGVLLKHRVGVTLRHVVLILWCFSTLYPILWVLMNAFKDNAQIYSSPFTFPMPVILKNFPQAFAGVNLPVTISNSLLYAAATCAIVILLSAMTAFYLTKMTKGSLLYTYLIMGMMVPVQAILIPIFISIRNMGLQNSRPGIILVYVTTNFAFSIFILTGFMKKGVPNDLIEAAIIDGCGPLGVFFHIALPISKPGIATVGTFVFLGIWNEFLYALILLSDPALRTLNLSCYNLRGQYSSDQGLMAAGVIILITPAVIIYALFQEQVVRGLTAGAVKG